jgi:beta-lactamase superfamily II metal-dependent hydrolase
MSDNDLELEKECVFYCQVESYRATKDYLLGGRCVRLLAVRESEFAVEILQSVTSLTIDIDFWQFCKLETGIIGWRNIPWKTRLEIEERDHALGRGIKWYRLHVRFVSRAKSYLYRTFSRQHPQYFEISSFQAHAGGAGVAAPPLARFKLAGPAAHTAIWPFGSTSLKKKFRFDTFHVGQGMCSLVHDETNGILLDMGAGKPVTRSDYVGGRINVNQLKSLINRLKAVWLVISHADSDHWRIMGWDPTLLSKISQIYAPSGAISVAMQDKALTTRIQGLQDTIWHLSANTTLQLLRSSPPPAQSDANGECLVAVFDRNGEKVLAAGDYVYKRFGTDGNPGIRALHSADYAAVVVPHHGDEASAESLVSPSHRAKAFFSAGTHQYWNHPKKASIDAHKGAKFKNISDPTQDNIIRVNLV